MNVVLYHLGRTLGTVPVLPAGIEPNLVVLIDGVWYELCVTCRQPTGVRTDTPINERLYYVETVGQLCARCYRS